MGSTFQFDLPLLALILTGGFVVSVVTLINTNLALVFVIFSMLLSPEIPIAHLAQRSVVVRLDDIFLIFLFFTWLTKMALNNELGFLVKTPVNRPFGVYVLVYAVVTALAIFFGFGHVRSTTAFFYLLKYAEYLMLFVLVANNIKSIRQCEIFTVFLLLTAVIVSIFGYAQIQAGVGRVSAPFEGLKTEPNTLAGYLIVIMGLAGGVFMHSSSFVKKVLLGAFFLIVFPVFLFTLSRGGYVSFIAMYLLFLILSKKRKVFIAYLAFIIILILPFVLPSKVATRIEKTFTGKTTYEVMERGFRWMMPLPRVLRHGSM